MLLFSPRYVTSTGEGGGRVTFLQIYMLLFLPGMLLTQWGGGGEGDIPSDLHGAFPPSDTMEK